MIRCEIPMALLHQRGWDMAWCHGLKVMKSQGAYLTLKSSGGTSPALQGVMGKWQFPVSDHMLASCPRAWLLTTHTVGTTEPLLPLLTTSHCPCCLPLSRQSVPRPGPAATLLCTAYTARSAPSASTAPPSPTLLHFHHCCGGPSFLRRASAVKNLGLFLSWFYELNPGNGNIPSFAFDSFSLSVSSPICLSLFPSPFPSHFPFALVQSNKPISCFTSVDLYLLQENDSNLSTIPLCWPGLVQDSWVMIKMSPMTNKEFSIYLYWMKNIQEITGQDKTCIWSWAELLTLSHMTSWSPS